MAFQGGETFDNYLSSFEQLETLRVRCYSGGKDSNWGNTQAKSIENFTKLTYLELAYFNNLTDFSFLKNLKNLRQVDIFYTGLSDLSFISFLPNLETLYVYNNSSLALETFDLDGKTVNTLDLLYDAFANNLRNVNISGCGIKKEDVEEHEIKKLAWEYFKY